MDDDLNRLHRWLLRLKEVLLKDDDDDDPFTHGQWSMLRRVEDEIARLKKSRAEETP